MKQIFLTLFSFFILNFQAQDDTKKFDVGLSYSLTHDGNYYNTPFSLSANYEIKSFENVSLKAGFRTFWFMTKDFFSGAFSDQWAFNPNISGNYQFSDSKLNAYLGLGYYYSSFTLKNVPDFENPFEPNGNGRNLNISNNGFTITPGIQYHFTSSFFADLNYTYISAKDSNTKDNFTDVLFNIGFGLRF